MSIVVENLNFTYGRKTPFEKKALTGVDLTINDGDFLGIIGHTGSGKSTFIQHLNALIIPQEGKVRVEDIVLSNIKKPKPDFKRLRSIVGMVFQYPEYQLFDETVEKDVSFGPKNLGLDKDDIAQRVKEAIELVGLDYESIKDRAPFELSGGQKRRVAIAGVIAMRPKVLILDEPTAGLDPYGKEQILNMITNIKEKSGSTVIVISHDVNEITRYATRIVVFNEGKVLYDLPMKELFKHSEELTAIGLEVPKAVEIANAIRKNGVDISDEIVTIEDLVNEINRLYKGGQQ